MHAEPAQQLNGMAAAIALAMQRIKRARDDKPAFIESVCRDNNGKAIVLHDVHQQWLRHVDYCWERNLRAIILAPFGHGKSTISIPLICWLIGQNPNCRIKVVTNDDPMAIKRVGAAKAILESPVYQNVFKVRKGERWTDHELYVRRFGQSIDPTLHARGVLTTGIGGRADYIFFDDVADQKNSKEPAQRKLVIDRVELTWLSRLEPNTGRALFIGTAWHAADVYHVLREKPGYCTLIQRVSQDCTRIEQEVMGVVDDQYPMAA